MDIILNQTKSLVEGEAIKHLFIKPITTIKEIEHDLKISNKSAYNLISTLLKKGIVYNISNKQRGAKYCFKDLMDILEDEI